LANGAGLRILSLAVRAFKSHPLHHLPSPCVHSSIFLNDDAALGTSFRFYMDDPPEIRFENPFSPNSDPREGVYLLSPFNPRDQAFCLDPSFLHRLTARGAFHGKSISIFWIYIRDSLPQWQILLSVSIITYRLKAPNKIESHSYGNYDLSLDTF
jgi:hypothetical protein